MGRSRIHMRLTGAELLVEGRVHPADITVEDGMLSTAPAPEVDLAGYLVLPGIIDLHGDAFERHMAPRPTAPFPPRMGFIGTDRDAAANGVTTAYLAQSWSWEGGHRAPEFAETVLAAHSAYAPHALTDLRMQIRCEVYLTDSAERLLTAIKRHGIGYVVFNNHLDQALERTANDPRRFAGWASDLGYSPEEFRALLDTFKAREPELPRFLKALATRFEAMGVRCGSHDDDTGAIRDFYGDLGARICEFPTSVAAATRAKERGEPVVAGAPNVVRGGSQAGNVSVADLVAAGQCDALLSDYHYPAMAAAAFRLADDGILPFAQAWGLISARPAAILGMTDRGTIAPGKRADLTIVNPTTRVVEGTLCAGRWSHLSGELAARVMSRARAPQVVAAQ